MNPDNQLIERIEKITGDLSAAFDRMRSIPGMYDETIKRKNVLCKSIPHHIRSKIIRIAVVGAIKSGKSTFINSWLKMDILKRGAGVVTSIVTRVKKGETLSAVVALKSWDEINDEVEKSLLFFPNLKKIAALNDISLDINGNGRWFDLRRRQDRKLLNSVKKHLRHADFLTETGLRQEFVIINQAIEGFKTIKTKVQPECTELVFSGDNFHKYKEFTGNDSLAFFVKDVCLYIADDSIYPFIEIADCQGSDSTNPFHMVEIQDYLVSSSMIVYLISSRTGIRKADINFLNIIRGMGLLDRIIFIVNFDFDEHDSLNDLICVENKIKQEISYIKHEPELFTFSSLYNLFSTSLNFSISGRNKNRLENWKHEPDLISYSDRMTKKFYSVLNEKLTHERNLLLVANHIAHIRIMENNAEKKVDLFQNLLSENLEKAETAVKGLKLMHQRARSFDSNIKNSLDISVEALKSDIEKEIHMFFDTKKGRAYKRIRTFIFNYNFDYEKYELQFIKTGFNNTIYHMFHDFRTVFDAFMAGTLASEIKGFIHEQELKINKCFRDFYFSNHIDPSEIFSEFTDMTGKSQSGIFQVEKFRLKGLQHGGASQPWGKKDLNTSMHAYDPVDMRVVSGIMDLAPLKPAFTTKYSARIKLDSMAGFCFHFLSGIINKMSKRKSQISGSAGLKSAGTRIKKQTLQSVAFFLNEYSTNLKDLYFFQLVPAVSRDFHEKLMDGFQMCDVEIEKIEALVKAEQWEKQSQIHILESIKVFLKNIYSETDTLLI